jgi:putative SOS response-associated peptidase YedK
LGVVGKHIAVENGFSPKYFWRIHTVNKQTWNAAWLGETGDGNLKELLLPYPADEMRMREISPRVNSAGV